MFKLLFILFVITNDIFTSCWHCIFMISLITVLCMRDHNKIKCLRLLWVNAIISNFTSILQFDLSLTGASFNDLFLLYFSTNFSLYILAFLTGYLLYFLCIYLKNEIKLTCALNCTLIATLYIKRVL